MKLIDHNKEWCIYSRLTKEEKSIVNKIVSDCLERNGFEPQDPWWEMNYLLPDIDIEELKNKKFLSRSYE